VVLVSGYTPPGHELGRELFVAKPFTAGKLVDAVQQAIAARRPAS
jgi:hypothetical protein